MDTGLADGLVSHFGKMSGSTGRFFEVIMGNDGYDGMWIWDLCLVPCDSVIPMTALAGDVGVTAQYSKTEASLIIVKMERKKKQFDM